MIKKHTNIWEGLTNDAVEMGETMENDGPVSAAQIRLAKGEITSVEYTEIISHLMKNVSSFQQTTSLKTLQIRYAKSELTAEQYQERLSNLMKKLYSQPWSPPLHILHIRYAEGEITSDEYTEMFENLTHEQFAYEQSTPLWILNNRYARGELNTGQYEEILSLFSSNIVTPPQETIIPKVTTPGSHGQQTSPPIEIQKPTVVAEPVVPDFKTSPIVTNKPAPENNDLIQKADLEEILEKMPAGNLLVDNSIQEFEKNLDIERTDETPVSSDPIVNSPQMQESPLNKVGAFHIPDLKPASVSHAPHFPSSLRGSMAATEALPSDFLYPTGKHEVDDDVGITDIQSHSDLVIDYSITPVSTGGRGNTYETVTSQSSLISTPGNDSKIEPNDEQAKLQKKNELGVTDIRQQIKMLIVKGDYIEAVALADIMIQDEPDNYKPYFFKGMAQYYLHIYDDALVDLNHAKELCKNKDDLKKIDTIRSHILNKKQEVSESEKIESEENAGSEDSLTLAQDEPSPELLDALGKEAQDLIDKKEFKRAEDVLSEFISHSTGLSQDRLRSESVDEIYAAMGYVKYQLKQYQQARENFHEALKINPANEIANQFMQDILIRAAKKK